MDRTRTATISRNRSLEWLHAAFAVTCDAPMLTRWSAIHRATHTTSRQRRPCDGRMV